jgi:hypothetical protein
MLTHYLHFFVNGARERGGIGLEIPKQAKKINSIPIV